VSNTADVPVPGYQKYWSEKIISLKAEYQILITKLPDEDEQLKHRFKILCDIEDVACYKPVSVREFADWSSKINTEEESRASYCIALIGKFLYSALYGTYAVILNDLKAVVKASKLGGHNKSQKAVGDQPT
jgi:hypothetical protein